MHRYVFNSKKEKPCQLNQHQLYMHPNSEEVKMGGGIRINEIHIQDSMCWIANESNSKSIQEVWGTNRWLKLKAKREQELSPDQRSLCLRPPRQEEGAPKNDLEAKKAQGCDVSWTMSRAVRVGGRLVKGGWPGGESPGNQNAGKTKMVCGASLIASVFWLWTGEVLWDKLAGAPPCCHSPFIHSFSN